MTLTRQNVGATLAKLDAWRQKAAAGGRQDDADLLDALGAMVAERFPKVAAGAIDIDRSGFVPSAAPANDVPGAECCPWTHEGWCARCQIDRTRCFVLPQIPGKVFHCLTGWKP